MNRRVSTIAVRGTGVDFAKPDPNTGQSAPAEFAIETDEVIIQAGNTKLVVKVADDKKGIVVVYKANHATGQKTVTVESTANGTTIKVAT